MSIGKSSIFARRAGIGIAILAVGGLVLSGCSSDGGTNSDGTTTITVMAQTNELSPEQITAFEKENPKIKVEFLEYDQTRLNAMLAAGESLDFVRSAPVLNTFAKGLAEPLDDYIADSDLIKEDDLLPVNDNWRWDGKTAGAGARYGIVKDWSPDATIWFNKAIFEEAGVAAPSTTEPLSWDALLDTAIDLKTAGVEMPLGVEWQWGLASPIRVMIEQQGGQLFNDDLTEIDFTSPEAKRAFQWFVDYAKAEVGPTSLNPLTDGYDLGVFSSEKMAMTTDGYWFGANFATDESAALQDKIALAPGATFGERVNPSYNGGIGAWMPAASKHKAEAWKFFEYYFGGQPAIDRATSGWGFPALESMMQYLPDDLAFQAQAIETATAEVPFSTADSVTPYLSGTQLADTIDRELQSVIGGDKTVDDALQTVEDEINGEIAKGKDQLG